MKHYHIRDVVLPRTLEETKEWLKKEGYTDKEVEYLTRHYGKENPSKKTQHIVEKHNNVLDDAIELMALKQGIKNYIKGGGK